MGLAEVVRVGLASPGIRLGSKFLPGVVGDAISHRVAMPKTVRKPEG